MSASPSPIVELEAREVTAGRLQRLFRGGAVAVVVVGDARIRQAWDFLVSNAGLHAERLPWEASLVEIARNHNAGNELGEHCGDMFHFTPGRLAYIARKVELRRDPVTNDLRCQPAAFAQQSATFVPDAEILELCWGLVADVMAALEEDGAAGNSYCAVVQRLKYQHRGEDIERLTILARSAVGRWARIGWFLDAYRETARGPLAINGLSDLFALLCLIPPARGPLMRLNAACAGLDRLHRLEPGRTMIGKPHYDGRYFSAMCGSRDNIATEVYDGRTWRELDMSPDRLVVLPGLLAAQRWKLRPTLHRVLHADATDGTGPNVTLLLGAKAA